MGTQVSCLQGHIFSLNSTAQAVGVAISSFTAQAAGGALEYAETMASGACQSLQTPVHFLSYFLSKGTTLPGHEADTE